MVPYLIIFKIKKYNFFRNNNKYHIYYSTKYIVFIDFIDLLSIYYNYTAFKLSKTKIKLN